MTKKNDFGYRTDRGWHIDDRYDLQVISHSDADLAVVRDDYMGAFKPNDPGTTQHPSGLGTISATTQQQGQTGLVVKIAATHAGLVTRNNGFYMPDKMRAAASTWTDHYPKPIQLHHGDSNDPVGRVIAARYVDTSGPVVDRFQNCVLRDQYNNQIGHADKKFWDRFISDKTSFIDKVQMIRVMDSVLNDAHYQGVGYIELTANITDPEAIQKVLDGRYVTGSVGAVSDKAVCSVCNTDWLEEEHCLLPGMMITMEDGTRKSIETVQIGDKVITHTGSIGTVTKIAAKPFQGKAIGINKVGTNIPLWVTDEHPIFAAQIKTESHRTKLGREFTKVIREEGFIDASELTDGYVATAIPTKSYIHNYEYSDDLAYMLGMYAAEGNTTDYDVQFTVHKDEVDQIVTVMKRVSQASARIYAKDNNEAVSIRFTDKDFRSNCYLTVPGTAKTKQVCPSIVFNPNDTTIRSFLGGLIDGDGSYDPQKGIVRISTASLNMASQVQIMLRRIGIGSRLYEGLNPGGPTNRDNVGIIYQVIIPKSQIKDLSLFSKKLANIQDADFTSTQQVTIDNRIYSKFEVSNKTYSGLVYDIQIEAEDDAHSFLANDIAVHNCGHRPGRVYDGKKCIVITGNLEYDEYSFVNVPADRHSGVLGVEQIKNSVRDSIDRTVSYFPVFNVSKEDSTMSDKKTETIKDSAVVTPETPAGVTDTNVETPTPEVLPTVQDQVAPTVDEKVTTLVDKLLSVGLSDEEHEELYQLQLADMDQTIVEDAKLSSEKRKKLASSTFCGPGRSFPVPDCAHVTAARRLIGRYKGEGSKESILACVARKAKALGCDSSKDSLKSETKVQDNVQEVVQENIQPVPVEHDFVLTNKFTGDITDQVKLDLSKNFLTQLVEKFGKDSLQTAVLELGLSINPEQIAALEAEVVANEEVIGDLRDQLAVLRKELKAAYEDVVTVEDQLIASREAVRSVKSEKASLLHVLEGSFTDAVKENILTLTDEALDSTIATLSAKVDITKIADKLNSGLSRTPNETVEIPAGLTEPSAVVQPSNKPTFATQQMVDEVYRRTLLSQGHQAAQAFYSDAVKRGLAKPRE